MGAGHLLLLIFTWVVLSALALDGRVLSALALELESVGKSIPHNLYKFLGKLSLRNSMEIIRTVM